MNNKSKSFRFFFICCPVIYCAAGLVLASTSSLNAEDWLQFRGSGGMSSSEAQLPDGFEDSIVWKSDLPAKGVSGPVVVGGKVVVTCSGGGDKQDQLFAVCFDVESGSQLWEQRFFATGRTFCHETSANAAPTPASDGEHVFAFYSSNDLACINLEDGSLKWYRALGLEYPKAGNDVGMSSSPAVHDGVVVVQSEGQGDAFAMGLDVETGATLWTIERPMEASWSSPLIVGQESSNPLVVLQSSGLLSIHELGTGEEVFSREGMVSTIPSSAYSDGLLFAPVDGVTAFSVSDGAVSEAWAGPHIKPGSASGIVYEDRLFALNRAGVLSSFDTRDGTEMDKIRVGGQYWATPVLAGDRAYLFTQDGTGKIVDLNRLELIDEYSFGDDEAFLGSPAISGGALFIRSNRYLYKIAEKDAT